VEERYCTDCQCFVEVGKTEQGGIVYQCSKGEFSSDSHDCFEPLESVEEVRL